LGWGRDDRELESLGERYRGLISDQYHKTIRSVPQDNKTPVVDANDGTPAEQVRSNRDSVPLERRTADLRANFDNLSGAVIGERSKTLVMEHRPCVSVLDMGLLHLS